MATRSSQLKVSLIFVALLSVGFCVLQNSPPKPERVLAVSAEDMKKDAFTRGDVFLAESSSFSHLVNLTNALTARSGYSEETPRCDSSQKFSASNTSMNEHADVVIARLFASSACHDGSSPSLRSGLASTSFDVQVAALEAWSQDFEIHLGNNSVLLQDVLALVAKRDEPLGWRYSVSSPTTIAVFSALDKLNGFAALAELLSPEDNLILATRIIELHQAKSFTPRYITAQQLRERLQKQSGWSIETYSFLRGFFYGSLFEQRPPLVSLGNYFVPTGLEDRICSSRHDVEGSLPEWGFSQAADKIRLYVVSTCDIDVTENTYVTRALKDSRYKVWLTGLDVVADLVRHASPTHLENSVLAPLLDEVETQFLNSQSFFNWRSLNYPDHSFYSFYLIHRDFDNSIIRSSLNQPEGMVFDRLWNLSKADAIQVIQKFNQDGSPLMND